MWRRMWGRTKEIEGGGGYLPNHPRSTNLQSCGPNDISDCHKGGGNMVRSSGKDRDWMTGESGMGKGNKKFRKHKFCKRDQGKKKPWHLIMLILEKKGGYEVSTFNIKHDMSDQVSITVDLIAVFPISFIFQVKFWALINFFYFRAKNGCCKVFISTLPTGPLQIWAAIFNSKAEWKNNYIFNRQRAW